MEVKKKKKKKKKVRSRVIKFIRVARRLAALPRCGEDTAYTYT